MNEELSNKSIELLVKELSKSNDDRLEILREISISLKKIATELEISNELEEAKMNRMGAPSGNISDRIRKRRL